MFDKITKMVSQDVLGPSRWWVPGAVFLGLFVAGRLWFFIHFPIPAIHPDSGSYLAVAETIQNGEVPRFGDRSPLYPALMALVFSMVDRAMALVYLQTLLALAAGLAMTYAVYSLRPTLSLFVAVALGAYFLDADALEHETALLTESLYTSLLLFTFASFLACFQGRRPSWWAGFFSAGMALIIYLKPGGMFLVVIYGMVLAYFLWRSVPWSVIFALALPLPCLLFCLAYYNQKTIGSFALSASDATEITFVTNFFWETDPSYPPEINRAIRKVQELTASRNTPQEIKNLKESWDVMTLYGLYLRGHYYDPQSEIAKVTQGWGKPDFRYWLLRISSDTIRRHPDQFLRHFLVMMIAYYGSVTYREDFRDYILNRVDLYYIQKHFSRERGMPEMVRLGKEFSDPTVLPPKIRITDFEKSSSKPLNERVVLEPTVLSKLYAGLRALLGPLVSFLGWSVAQVAILIASFWILCRNHWRHDGAFILMIFCCTVLGSAMVVSLVEYAQPRYSYPLEWTYYVSVLCLPLISTGKNLLLPRKTVFNKIH